MATAESQEKGLKFEPLHLVAGEEYAEPLRRMFLDFVPHVGMLHESDPIKAIATAIKEGNPTTEQQQRFCQLLSEIPKRATNQGGHQYR